MEFLQAGSQKRLSKRALFAVVDEDERMRLHVLELGPNCGHVGGGTFKRQGIVGGLRQLGGCILGRDQSHSLRILVSSWESIEAVGLATTSLSLASCTQKCGNAQTCCIAVSTS